MRMVDLLYAMILPSGNDAAEAVAGILGEFVVGKKSRKGKKS